MDAANRVEGLRVSAHEGGHNLGLQHSSSRDFATETLGAPGVQGTLSEYGDNYSNMGSGSGHYAMSQKVQLGWAGLDSGTHQVQTVQSAGSFTIKPAEDLVGGLKALKVKRGTDTSNTNWLYVSYRQQGGDYDTTSTSAGHNNAALIRYEDSITRSSGKTHVIDFTPANGWSDVALATGQTWADTYSNLSITVGAATATSLDVTINYGPIPCTELAPTLSLAPASQSAFAGGSASMTATVTNNDGSGCSASTFALTPSIPAGWGYTAPANLTLSSAQTDTATFTVNPPAGTSPATYPAALTADHPNGTLNGSDSANIHVVAPLTDIAISSVSGPANAEVGSSVNVNVTVQNVGNQDVVNNIDVTLVDSTDGPTIGSKTIAGGLAPGASTTLTFPWDTSGASSPADHTLTANHNFPDENGSNDSGSTVVAVNDPFSIASFSPPVIQKGTTVPVSIAGSGFLAGATVQFLNGNGPTPTASNVVVVDSSTITAMVNAPGGGGRRDRQWDARVNSGGASATMADALTLSNNAPPNTAPSVSISSPANGSSYNMLDNVSFAGTATDAEDVPLTSPIAWTSNIDGSIDSGGAFSATLSPGPHTITASVTDSGGMTGSDTVSVTIQNDAPTVSIGGPASGSSFAEGTSVPFSGTASDTEDGGITANLSWTSSIDGVIGSGGSFSSTLSGGSHTITASVTDAGGTAGSDSVTVSITVANNAPTVSISSPSGGSTFNTTDSITFAGSANDVEDGNLTTDISWTSNIDGSIGSGTGFSTSLSEGSHVITGMVTDSGSKTGTDTVSISVTVSSSVSLSANGYKVKGRHRIDLTWSGAVGGNIEIRRDGSLLTTTANDGVHTDATNNKGGRTYVYQVCETGGGACSNTATVNF